MNNFFLCFNSNTDMTEVLAEVLEPGPSVLEPLTVQIPLQEAVPTQDATQDVAFNMPKEFDFLTGPLSQVPLSQVPLSQVMSPETLCGEPEGEPEGEPDVLQQAMESIWDSLEHVDNSESVPESVPQSVSQGRSQSESSEMVCEDEEGPPARKRWRKNRNTGKTHRRNTGLKSDRIYRACDNVTDTLKELSKENSAIRLDLVKFMKRIRAVANEMRDLGQ